MELLRIVRRSMRGKGFEGLANGHGGLLGDHQACGCAGACERGLTTAARFERWVKGPAPGQTRQRRQKIETRPPSA